MSIVKDLQSAAMNPESSLTELLGKSYFVARKLQIKEFAAWADSELNGYNSNEVPEYRKITGFIQARNPYCGWIPIIDNSVDNESLRTMRCTFSISEIESQQENSKGSGTIRFSFPKKIEQMLMKDMVDQRGNPLEFQPSLAIATSKMRAMTTSVRHRILEWALKLEEDGILGNDMSFTEHEVKKAAKSSHTTINFHGDVSNSQIQQHTESSSQTQTNNTQEFESNLSNLIEMIETSKQATPGQIELAEAQAAILQSQAQLPATKQSKTMIEKAWNSLSNISTTLSLADYALKIYPYISRLL